MDGSKQVLLLRFAPRMRLEEEELLRFNDAEHWKVQAVLEFKGVVLNLFSWTESTSPLWSGD